MAKRRLIPEDKIIVILDTSPVRNLAHSEIPDWVRTFADMAEDGYSFSLAETTAAELLMQVRSGRIPEVDFHRMIGLLKTFLNLNAPVLPGQVDLEVIIGAKGEPYSIEETIFLSHESWRMLTEPFEPSFHKGPSFDDISDEERDEWNKWLQSVLEHSICYGIDVAKSNPDDTAKFLAAQAEKHLSYGVDIEPQMAIRMHLEIRYRLRQMARSAQKKRPYNPKNSRNKNDAIDLGLYRYLILPALVVAQDNGFFGSLENIESFQVGWFFRPEELALKWMNGERPQPKWPTSEPQQIIDED